jgi:ribosome-binding factor A
MTRRTERLNSLLKEVIVEVIRADVRNPYVPELITITQVDISKDLHYAKVFFSLIGTDDDKQKALAALQSAAGFIAVTASKKVVLRHFPELTFKIDTSVDKHMRIEMALQKIHEEESERRNLTS